jgi:lipopolysaccharide biosynthesis protein
LPADLGFYDLSFNDSRVRQQELARRFGIDGFCYYYYWFDQVELLSQPLSLKMRDSSDDFPFCLIWVNENWTRKWDGGSDDIIIEQHYRQDWESRFVDAIEPLIVDKRYIRVEGRPIVLIYWPSKIPDLERSIERLRAAALRKNIDLFLVSAIVFEMEDRPPAFDWAVEFPPHRVHKRLRLINDQVEDLDPAFRGMVLSYDDFLTYVQNNRLHEKTWPTAMLGWDNSARVGEVATIFHDCSPRKFQRLLEIYFDRVRTVRKEYRFVFINAWNEWAEGSYLEPDNTNGLEWLKSVKCAQEASIQKFTTDHCVTEEARETQRALGSLEQFLLKEMQVMQPALTRATGDIFRLKRDNAALVEEVNELQKALREKSRQD